ncbi:MAG: LysR family transcriptional regulator [Clostridiaceae bacterium]|jgi:DNA-binding transcriptional LysR family regulator|nr:LysR family transcriptional regulator [Clostridiaceae bacterium]
MTLQQLRYFVETARTLHYTKAAEHLNVSQPSLSYALSQLSRKLGVPLFKMDGLKVSLTEYGEAFLPYAESALSILVQGEAQLNKMHNPSNGNINLGYIYTVSFDAIPQLIDEFYIYRGNRNINFSFQVNMTNLLIKKLIEGSLDVVMAPSTVIVSECIGSIPVFEQELYLVVYNNHPLVRHTSVTIDDFKNERLIMIKKETDLFLQTDSLFKKHNITPNVFFEVDECNSMASFVGAQLGIAIMPKIPSLDSYNITAVPFEGRTVSRTISILWNNCMKHTPALKSFLNYCASSRLNKSEV